MKYIVLTLCLYMAHVGCQQQQHEQRMPAIASVTGSHDGQLPDQEMASSQESVVVVPLSHIDSSLPFESFKSFTYIPPNANASTAINSMEPTATVSHVEQPIHAAAQAIVSLTTAFTDAASQSTSTSESSANQIKAASASNISPMSSSSASDTSPEQANPPQSDTSVLATVDIKADAQISPKTSMDQATILPNNPNPIPPPADSEAPPPPAPAPASPPTPPPPPAAADIAAAAIGIGAQANNKATVAAPNAAASVTTVTATVTKSITETATVTLSYEDAAEKRMKSCYRKNRKVPFSQYWIPKENEWDETNNGKRVFLGGNEKVKLNDEHNQPLGEVAVQMYDKCKMEGTCLLENGDLINIDNTTDNFIKVGGRGREHNVFGLGSGAQNLVPYISVAANDLPYGQKLYISKLDGVDLGYGIKHNGCVRVDDDSWSFESCQIDFFVLSYVDYLWLELDDEVSIKFADCELKNYITPQHLALVKATSNEEVIPSLMSATYKQ